MESVSIILLAGGEASRYNISFDSQKNAHYDKLLSNRGNISLLEYVTNEIRPLGEIIIVTRGEKRKQQYSALVNKEYQNDTVTVITEDRKKTIGPIGGIHSALKLCKKIQTKVILPADLPNVRQDFVAEFIAKASQSEFFDLVSLVHPNGQIENLVLVGHGNELLRASQLLIDKGIYRVSSIPRLISKKRFLNSSYMTKDIDTEEIFNDLDSFSSISKINTKYIPVIKFHSVDFGSDKSTNINHEDPSVLYQQSLDLRIKRTKKDQQKSVSSLVTTLLKESKIYRKKGLLSLSLHCLLDVHRIKEDPIIANQINDLIMKLGTSGKNSNS